VVGGDLKLAESSARQLIERLTTAHHNRFGSTDGLLVGLQLTHSGRFSFPHEKSRREPIIAYHHPVLDRRCGIAPDNDSVIATDDFLEELIENYIQTAIIAQRVGYHFVDVKHCHGYLGHELLSAYTREGKFGGSFENRTRFMRSIIEGIQARCPGLLIGVRLSAFDTVPYKPDPARSVPGKLGPGIPEEYPLPYPYGFGLDQNNPLKIDLTETIQLLQMLSRMNVRLVNVSGGSPYYCPHVQRPAAFPPSDGYQPPEDPLIGVDRQVQITRQLKAACPDSVLIGSGYTYLQDYLPHVSQAIVREGWTDFVGIGRMVLSYWDMIADSLEGKPITTNRVCRTFSDCTSAPRAGLISGCYPLDKTYKLMPQHDTLKAFKAKAAGK
jgi:2,4-dienoyl-CoA reductase-like NADH-dependent reductase (Old Yellow Enzyme family)